MRRVAWVVLLILLVSALLSKPYDVWMSMLLRYLWNEAPLMRHAPIGGDYVIPALAVNGIFHGMVH